MNRRLFLKALALSPIVPSVLMAKGKASKIKCGERGCCLECDKKDDCFQYKQDQVIIDMFIKKPERWFTLKLTPEYEKIPGAKEWMQLMEDDIHKECPNPPKFWVV